MKVCFDTSVLVAALVEQHPQNGPAFTSIQKVRSREIEGCITTHAIAELYATLTALPLKPRIQPHEALRLLEESVYPHFTIIPLSHEDYLMALDLVTTGSFSSGAIYDALHVAGALQAGCDQLLTFNLKHFKQLAPQVLALVSP